MTSNESPEPEETAEQDDFDLFSGDDDGGSDGDAGAGAEDGGESAGEDGEPPAGSGVPPGRKKGRFAWVFEPENLRVFGLLLTIAIIAVLTRVNGCDYQGVANRVAKLEDVAGIKASLNTRADGLSAQARQIATVQTQFKDDATSRLTRLQQTADGITRFLGEHTDQVVYTWVPRGEEKPPKALVDELRREVEQGSKFRVVHHEDQAGAPRVVTDCTLVRADAAYVTCVGPVLPVDLEKPSGRRFQEAVRNDGTLLLNTWDADGSHQGGNKLYRVHATTWIAARPQR